SFPLFLSPPLQNLPNPTNNPTPSHNTFETNIAGVEKIEKFFASHRSLTYASNQSFVVFKFLALLLCYGMTQLELVVELKDVIVSKSNSRTQLQLGANFRDVYC
ncbi:Hypothetical predicted protein, partial [Prunus dulcis]